MHCQGSDAFCVRSFLSEWFAHISVEWIHCITAFFTARDMQGSARTVLLEKMDEERFLRFLNEDRVRHIFAIYDLKNAREKTKFWVSFQNDEITGFLFEYDEKIIHTHGTPESVCRLLDFAKINEPVFIIELPHLPVVSKVFEPVQALDPFSKGKTTIFLVMKTDIAAFKPVYQHPARKLSFKDLKEIKKSLGEEYEKRAEKAMHTGFAFGAFYESQLGSFAAAPELLDDLALIRGVYTVPSLRNKGLATSVCSALVEEIIRIGKQPMLWVAESNLPARRTYRKLGFKKTGHVLIGFKARRLQVSCTVGFHENLSKRT